MTKAKNNIPNDDEILSVVGSVPVEMAARYLGVPKDFIYGGLQKQALPFGTAILMNKHWAYDIRPKALVEYNNHGGIRQYEEFKKHLLAIVNRYVS